MNPTPLPALPVKKKSAPAWRRQLPWVGGAGLIALIVVGLWPRPMPVELAPVTRGPLVVTVDEEGMTRVKNRYAVSAPVADSCADRLESRAVVAAGQPCWRCWNRC